MKLRYSPTSPYVRKVLVAAIELGQSENIELIPTNPWDPDSDIAVHNPLGKVPALLTEGNEVLYDSNVITEYLDTMNPNMALFPQEGRTRWNVLRRRALADGILDAAILRLLESRRGDDERSQGWMDRQHAAYGRALDQLETEADMLGQDVNVGTIAIAVALGYLDFRFGDEDWRGDHPALADWYDLFAERRSMEQTVPKDPS